MEKCTCLGHMDASGKLNKLCGNGFIGAGPTVNMKLNATQNGPLTIDKFLDSNSLEAFKVARKVYSPISG